MELFLIGLSHKSAPLDVRERLAVPEADLDALLQEYLRLPGMSEAVMVSTCNRVEVYGVADTAAVGQSGVRNLLGAVRGLSAELLSAHLYEQTEGEAVRHIFRVASSLDSMVVGEPQILGQVKEAYGRAARVGSVGPLLSRCFHRAFAVAKRVRTETGIARHAVSVSQVAVEVARQIFEDLTGRSALVVGAGEMSEQTARSLKAAGVQGLWVVNRSQDKAEALAEACGGRARPFDELHSLLEKVDVAITSTAAQKFILGKEDLQRVMKARRRRPLFLIDIAVPRDIDPRVGELDNVYLYDVDDLRKVADDNLQERLLSAREAEQIVESEAGQFLSWRRSQGVSPTLRDLRERFTQVSRSEAERALSGPLAGLGEREKRVVQQTIDGIIGKLLHAPLTNLKKAAGQPHVDGARQAEVLRRMFDLPEQREVVPADQVLGDEPEAPVAVGGLPAREGRG